MRTRSKASGGGDSVTSGIGVGVGGSVVSGVETGGSVVSVSGVGSGCSETVAMGASEIVGVGRLERRERRSGPRAGSRRRSRSLRTLTESGLSRFQQNPLRAARNGRLPGEVR